MLNKTQRIICAAFLTMLLAPAANSFPTKVKLLKDPNYSSSKGVSVLVTTNKGTVQEDDNAWGVYEDFRKAKKGSCYILETETESSVKFNKGLNDSEIRSIRQVDC